MPIINSPGETPERLIESLDVVDPKLILVAIPLSPFCTALRLIAKFCTSSDGVESTVTESVYSPLTAVKLAGCPNFHVWLAVLISLYGSIRKHVASEDWELPEVTNKSPAEFVLLDHPFSLN